LLDNHLLCFFVFQFVRLVYFALSISLVFSLPDFDHQEVDSSSRKPDTIEPYMDDSGRICQVNINFISI
jgi:hypothetical protein